MTFDIFTEEGLRSSGYQIDTRMISLFKRFKKWFLIGYFSFAILVIIIANFPYNVTKSKLSTCFFIAGVAFALFFYICLANMIFTPVKMKLTDREKFDYDLYCFHRNKKNKKNVPALSIAYYSLKNGDLDGCGMALRHVLGVAGFDKYLQKMYYLLLFISALHNSSYEFASKYLEEYKGIEIKYANNFIGVQDLQSWLDAKTVPDNIGYIISNIPLSHTVDGTNNVMLSMLFRVLTFLMLSVWCFCVGLYIDPYHKITVLASAGAMSYLWATIIIMGLGILFVLFYNWRIRYHVNFYRIIVAIISLNIILYSIKAIWSCAQLAIVFTSL